VETADVEASAVVVIVDAATADAVTEDVVTVDVDVGADAHAMTTRSGHQSPSLAVWSRRARSSRWRRSTASLCAFRSARSLTCSWATS
jgi:hypothetical protein